MNASIYTIGHSHHRPEFFLDLLRQHGVNAIADVRSQPFSRFNPEFSQQALKAWLTDAGLGYVFLGRELGARSSDPECYRDGKVVYERLASRPEFQAGLDRLTQGSARHRIALLCAEKEPLDCHRTILISRHLTARGISVCHILCDGTAESHDHTLQRLLAGLGLDEPHMFRTHHETLELAYERQEERIAYQEPEAADPVLVA